MKYFLTVVSIVLFAAVLVVGTGTAQEYRVWLLVYEQVTPVVPAEYMVMQEAYPAPVAPKPTRAAWKDKEQDPYPAPPVIVSPPHTLPTRAPVMIIEVWELENGSIAVLSPPVFAHRVLTTGESCEHLSEGWKYVISEKQCGKRIQ